MVPARSSQMSHVPSSKAKSEFSVNVNNNGSTKAGVVVETMSAPNPVSFRSRYQLIFSHATFNFTVLSQYAWSLLSSHFSQLSGDFDCFGIHNRFTIAGTCICLVRFCPYLGTF